MTDLIPHLRDLCFNGSGFRVPNGFAETFVKLHREDWRVAQAHWEQIVALVLETDAVDAYASKGRAIYQAVAAAAILLDRSDLRNRCPRCEQPADILDRRRR